MKLIYIILFVALAAQAKGQIINCYVCDGDDCNGTSVKTQRCGPDEATTEEPEHTTSGTEATTNGSEETSTGETSTTNPTTSSGETTTKQPETTTGSLETTTKQPEPTTSTTEKTTTTQPEITTTAAGETTKQAETSTEAVSTTKAAGTTEGAATTTKQPDVTTKAAGTTKTPAEATTLSDAEPPTVAPPQKSVVISKRSLSAADTLINNYRLISRSRRDADGVGYGCYTVETKDDDKTKIRKGCVAIPTGKSGCEAVHDEIGDKVVDNTCVVCMRDLCNSSSMLKLSILSLFLAVIVKFLM